MSTLSDFLLARFAEDEAVARRVTLDDGTWSWASVDFNFSEAAEHGNRWSPARVLAECEAKRRIVEWAESPPCWYAPCGLANQVESTDALLRALALPHADHPDFDPAWRT